MLADIKENILTVDTNGIGYINQWIFDKTYTRPIVIDGNGNNLDSLLVDFTPTAFWGVGKSCCIDKEQVYSISFKIKRNKTEEIFKYRSLTDLVDRRITKKMKPDRYTIIQTETTAEN
ncbi:hypothetical protein [Sphingobacterium pedocola]|uniref:hypothetical protein n=1 Tax=Sphingobacterium pedocola TaxID=2082722 RepID=UPI0018C9F254|nr:hypothetical protein [Sphingobacterium pedocola]